MSLVVVGINHRTAPVELRERVVFEPSRLGEALVALARQPAVRESLIVSTCNRTELYCVTGAEATDLGQWLASFHGLESGLDDCLYRLQDSRAVAHAFSVASGLDSMVLGEPQILGQFKDAYRYAIEAGTAGPTLNRLFQNAFSVAKRVRTQTRIGASSVSVAAAAVGLARTVFASLEERTALMVGAGETIALAARHLHGGGLRRMIVANRSRERAQELATEFQGFAIGLEDLGAHLAEADIVVTSTASPTVLITVEMVKAALRTRKRRPMFMVDIAVPRDIDPRVGELEDIYLFSIDDLQNVVDENLEARREAAREADELIAGEVDRFELGQRTLDVAPAIRRLREEAEGTRAQTLEQARRMLANGRPPEEALEFLSRTLTNRLLHSPSQRLREAAENGDQAVLAALARVYDPDHEP